MTLGVMLSLFLAAMEATVVATAMPTIVSQLGGLSIYSWVFSAYMLASTTTIPLYGKLSDIYGRKPIYVFAMALFLGGALLAGRSGSMAHLIAARAMQGLGAGGLLPLAFVMVGAMFSFDQRARMQGLFSGVWGVSSVIGPLLGGFLVDRISWHWVFYVNIVPGLLAAAIIWVAWVDDPRPAGAPAPRVDYLGAALMTLCVLALLLGLFELDTGRGPLLLGGTAALLALLLFVEARAPDPVIPLALFRDRLFRAACGHGVLAGCSVFGSVAFVPLFVQGVLATSATSAGAMLMPLMLGWVFGSIVGSRLLLRVGYRAVALAGAALLVIGTAQMSRIGEHAGRPDLIAGLAPMGIGMGLSIPAFLIAVQTAVPREVLGTATSTVQFSRSIGGAVGVSVMGVWMHARLTGALAAAGLDAEGAGAADLVARLMDPLARSTGATGLEGTLRASLAGAIQGVFVTALIAAALALVVTATAPRGKIAHLARRRKRWDEPDIPGPRPSSSPPGRT